MGSFVAFGPGGLAGSIRRIVCLCLVMVPSASVVGCADEANMAPPGERAATSVTDGTSSTGLGPARPPGTLTPVGMGGMMSGMQGQPGEAPIPSSASARKIIYDARIDLVVGDLNGLESSILDLVREHGGFLAESDLSRQAGAQRSSTWRVRVPVDRFDAFVHAVGRLGEVRTSHIGSQDVTEEYVDIEARVRNKQEEEKRLLKHLVDSTGKLEEILKIEAELSRVRGEVERMQGRLRFLANRADLATITIVAIERKVEPKVATAPEPETFSTRVRDTFSRSLGVLIAVGEAAAIIAVALLPWLPVIFLAGLIAYAMYRSSSRAGAERMPRPASSGPETS